MLLAKLDMFAIAPLSFSGVDRVKGQLDELSFRIRSINQFIEITHDRSSTAEMAYDSLKAGFNSTSARLGQITNQVSELTTLSEWLIEEAVLSGAKTNDSDMVDLAVDEYVSIIDRRADGWEPGPKLLVVYHNQITIALRPPRWPMTP